MDHSTMDHSMMNHTVDHSMMNHSGHHNHNMTDMTGGSGHSGHQHGGHDMGDMPGMTMYFHTGIMEYVLFESCMTSSDLGMFAACAVVFAVSILYEGLKFFREVMLQNSLASETPVRYIDNKTTDNGTGPEVVNQQMSVASRMFSSGHLIQTVLHVLQVFISYCLMLVFMTYNVWLCLAVILGAGFGYFLFGWKRAVVVDANEHCH